MKKLLTVMMVLAIVGSFAFANGQVDSSVANYPERPVETTVQWNAGGGADLAFRAFAEVWSAHTGQQMVVKNNGGGSGVPGTVEFLATAQPDGYSMMHWSNAHVSNMHMQEAPFDNSTFKHVCEIVENTHYILVPADSQFKTLADLLDYAKKNPGKLTLGNAGVGGGNHFAALMLEKATGVQFSHVPYASGSASITGILSGEVMATVNNSPEGYANVQSGQLRMLVCFGAERLKDFPDCPTAKELGFDIVLKQWRGLAVPKDTPDEIVAKINAIAKEVCEDPAYIEKINALGATPAYLSTKEYNEFILKADADFKDIVISMGLGTKYKK